MRSTSAVDVRTQAVSPVSILATAAVSSAKAESGTSRYMRISNKIFLNILPPVGFDFFRTALCLCVMRI